MHARQVTLRCCPCKTEAGRSLPVSDAEVTNEEVQHQGEQEAAVTVPLPLQ